MVNCWQYREQNFLQREVALSDSDSFLLEREAEKRGQALERQITKSTAGAKMLFSPSSFSFLGPHIPHCNPPRHDSFHNTVGQILPTSLGLSATDNVQMLNLNTPNTFFMKTKPLAWLLKEQKKATSSAMFAYLYTENDPITAFFIKEKLLLQFR